MLLPLATDVDNVKILFEESSLTTLKIVIGAILFGIALDTSLDDFAAALRRPWSITVGVNGGWVHCCSPSAGCTSWCP